jgi:hypothetical protein
MYQWFCIWYLVVSLRVGWPNIDPATCACAGFMMSHIFLNINYDKTKLTNKFVREPSQRHVSDVHIFDTFKCIWNILLHQIHVIYTLTWQSDIKTRDVKAFFCKNYLKTYLRQLNSRALLQSVSKTMNKNNLTQRIFFHHKEIHFTQKVLRIICYMVIYSDIFENKK